VNHYE